MKSGKQKRKELKAAKLRREQKKYVLKSQQKEVTANTAPCNLALLELTNIFWMPLFAERSYYCDVLFKCVDCGRQQVWTATRQKWWYEVAKGDVWTVARRCNACRRKEGESPQDSSRRYCQKKCKHS